MLRAEVVEKIRHDLHLFRRTQISGVDAVEAKPQAFPVGGNVRNIGGKVVKGVPGKSPCMGGEHSRGDDRRLDPHCRNDRQRNGEGALAEAGNILNCNDFLHFNHSFICIYILLFYFISADLSTFFAKSVLISAFSSYNPTGADENERNYNAGGDLRGRC